MTTAIHGLTERHFEIARLLWEGYPRKAIRLKLDLSETSVRNEINYIADMLQLDRSKSIDAQIIRWLCERCDPLVLALAPERPVSEAIAA